MRRITRLGGALAAIGLAAGLTLAVPGAALATAGCPAWDGTQPPVPGGPVAGGEGSPWAEPWWAGGRDWWCRGRTSEGDYLCHVSGGRWPL